MQENNRYLQLRLSSELLKEIERAAKKHSLPSAQIIRSALFWGLPVLDSMMELQKNTTNRIIELLRKESKSSTRRDNSGEKGDSDKKIMRDEIIPHYNDEL